MLTMAPDQPNDHIIEITLVADGEDLAAHIAGRERCDADARWHELVPAYEHLAANVG